MALLKAQWEDENRRARPVGDTPGDMLLPSVGLDVGPLNGSDVGKDWFNQLTVWLGAASLTRTATQTTAPSGIWDRVRLLEAGNHGEAMRIWYSDAPNSLCRFYDVLWQLPRWMPLEDSTMLSCLNWGDLLPGDWAAYLLLEREIHKTLRRTSL